ncbi:MAG: WD40/YVTN/BNR-like repeat-containing protein [Fidelibacterota bacterium]
MTCNTTKYTFIFIVIVNLSTWSCNESPILNDFENCYDSGLEHGQWHLLGLEDEKISAIAIDFTNECILYAGSGSNFSEGKVGGVFKSIDGGATWDTIVSGVTVRDIDIHPSDTDIFYVTAGTNYLTQSGILRSVDGGRSWSWVGGIPIIPDRGPSVLEIDPLNPTILYVGTSGLGSGALYKTTNAGQTWERIGETSIIYGGVTALAIDAYNPATLYVGTDMTGAILKSTDGGSSWQRLDFPEVGIVHDLLVHPSDSDIIYAGTWRTGFYSSNDGGITWQHTNSGLQDTTSVRKIVLSQNEIFIATNDRHKGAIYKSDPQDINWLMVGDQVFDQVRTVSSVLDSNRIFVGVDGIYAISPIVNNVGNR